MFDLKGHVALITGGNGGIGLGIARGLAKAGAQIAIWGRNLKKNETAVKELETHPLQSWDKFNKVVIQGRTPAGRWGTPADFEALAVYLASPASSYHTSDALRVDGGYAVL